MRYKNFPIFILFFGLCLLAACRPVAVSSPVPATVETSPLPEVAPSDLPTQPTVKVSEKITPTVHATLYIDNAYTGVNPLTDPVKIQQILDQFQQYQLDWFSNIGWMHYTLITADASDFTRIEHFWVHVTDKNLGCEEQFVYFEHDGEILPYTIRLADGVTGSIQPVTEGKFNADFIHESSPVCTLKSDWIVTLSEREDNYGFILHDEAGRFRTFMNQEFPGIEKHVQAWTQEVDGKQTFVIKYEKNYTDPAMAGMVYDARAGIFNLPAWEVQWVFIDSENGLPVQERVELYDQNGQQLNIWRSGTDIGILYFYEFYESLPEPIAQVYEQSAEKLRIFLQENQP